MKHGANLILHTFGQEIRKRVASEASRFFCRFPIGGQNLATQLGSAEPIFENAVNKIMHQSNTLLMRFISLASLTEQAAGTFRRFPLPLLFAVAATISMICLVHEEPTGDEFLLTHRLAMTFYLGMLFTISVSLFTERFVATPSKRLLIWSASLVLTALYFLTLPPDMDGVPIVRFALLAVALHLLVAFAPFAAGSEMNGLWQFNKSLFIRILIGGVYSGFLYGGLALAILAIDKLFEVNIDEKFYAYLWFTIAGVFNTWFFLSGVPKKLTDLENTTDYPKGLKIFTLYVLLPLITVYLVILYAYAGKILLTSVWPVGWVANLVIAFSIFGILSFLLIYPLRNDEANPWVKTYSRLFYFLLVPLIVLLYVSIFKRINMYGITVERYFVVLLAVWLSFIAGYFILTSGKRIRVIPLSLCIITLLATFGPWGAFAVSRESQINELSALLESNQILVKGKVDATRTHEVKFEDYERIESIVGYLNEMHGYRSLQLFFAQNLDSVVAKAQTDTYSAYDRKNKVLEIMKLERLAGEDGASSNMSFGIKDNVLIHSEGYDFFGEVSRFYYDKERDTQIEFYVEPDTVRLASATNSSKITLTYRDLDSLTFDINVLLDSLPGFRSMDLSPEELTTASENSQWKAKLVLRSLEVSKEKGEWRIDEMRGTLMVRFLDAAKEAGRPVSQ